MQNYGAYIVLDIRGFGLAAAVGKPVKQVSRLAKLSAGINRDKSVSPDCHLGIRPIYGSFVKSPTFAVSWSQFY